MAEENEEIAVETPAVPEPVVELSIVDALQQVLKKVFIIFLLNKFINPPSSLHLSLGFSS